jgi:hypothetical protein
MKLSIEAHRKGLDRSDVVNLILAEALRHIVISVRGQETSPVSANPGVESSQANATAA